MWYIHWNGLNCVQKPFQSHIKSDAKWCKRIHWMPRPTTITTEWIGMEWDRMQWHWFDAAFRHILLISSFCQPPPSSPIDWNVHHSFFRIHCIKTILRTCERYERVSKVTTTHAHLHIHAHTHTLTRPSIVELDVSVRSFIQSQFISHRVWTDFPLNFWVQIQL